MRYAKQQYRAKNDSNGNPRRFWRLYDVSGNYARIAGTRDEGYDGAPRGTGWDGACLLPPVDVTVSEYREAVG